MTVTNVTEAFDAISAALRGARFRYADEDELQRGVALAFEAAGITHQREVRLDARDRLDFLVRIGAARIVVEVKIEGTRNALLAQVIRYGSRDDVDAIVIVAGRSRFLNMPTTAGGKPLRVVSILEGRL